MFQWVVLNTIYIETSHTDVSFVWQRLTDGLFFIQSTKYLDNLRMFVKQEFRFLCEVVSLLLLLLCYFSYEWFFGNHKHRQVPFSIWDVYNVDLCKKLVDAIKNVITGIGHCLSFAASQIYQVPNSFWFNSNLFKKKKFQFIKWSCLRKTAQTILCHLIIVEEVKIVKCSRVRWGQYLWATKQAKLQLMHWVIIYAVFNLCLQSGKSLNIRIIVIKHHVDRHVTAHLGPLESRTTPFSKFYTSTESLRTVVNILLHRLALSQNFRKQLGWQ